MHTFTPEIYRHLGTHVAVDLGAATKIGEIGANVDTLKTELTRVPGHIDATVDSVKAALSTTSQKTDAAVAGLLQLVQAEQQAAASRQQELLAQIDALKEVVLAQAGSDDEEDDDGEDEEGVPDVTAESAPRVAALVAVQAVVVNGTSTANDYQGAFNKADGVLRKFLLPTEVQAEWLALVVPPSGWAARSERYWALAELIDTLAEPLDPIGPGAGQAAAS